MLRASRWWARMATMLLIWGLLSLVVVSPDKYLLIKFLDVGQGDAILIIEHDSGARVLLDGGPYSQVIYEMDKTLPFWQRSLTAVIASHPDDDHISGLVEVMRRYDVGMYLWNGVSRETPAYTALTRVVEFRQVSSRVPVKGQVLELSRDLSFEWWWPDWQKDHLSVNDGSQVILVRYGYFSALMTGDAEAGILQRLSREFGQGVDLLKVSHHGAKNGLNDEVMLALRPQWSVISAGVGNRYGHPSSEVLELLSGHDTEVWRTDQGGSVEVVVRGDGVSVYQW